MRGRSRLDLNSQLVGSLRIRLNFSPSKRVTYGTLLFENSNIKDPAVSPFASNTLLFRIAGSISFFFDALKVTIRPVSIFVAVNINSVTGCSSSGYCSDGHASHANERRQTVLLI